MRDKLDGKIPADDKIIVGAEYSQKTGWHSLHLHDALYAVSVRPAEQVVVIAEGPGRGRLRHLRVPFKNIFRFKAVRVPTGHDFLTHPVDADQLGDCRLIRAGKPFGPVMVQLLIRHSARPDFVSIHDIGVTPLPLLVPQLSALSETGFAGSHIALKSADDCFTLAASVADWVRDVNARIKEAVEAAPVPAEVGRPSRAEVQRIYDALDRSKPDVLQTLVSAYAAVYVSILLVNSLRMARTVKIRSCFPLNLTREDAVKHPHRYSTIDELFAISERYQKETKRPIEEAYEAICEHLGDLKKRPMTIDSSEGLKFLKNNAPMSIGIIDPTRRINEKRRVLEGPELRHAEQLQKVFKNEGVSIHYLERLPFLSLLVQYDTKGGKSRYAAIIKKDAHPALQDFLLSHEMGHLFCHLYDDPDSKAAARSEKLDLFLRSSADEDTFLEHEANDFGMAVLFPPAYLADREMFMGKLSAEALLREFLQGRPASAKLRKQMRLRIGEHIKKYEQFKNAKAPTFLTLEVKSIEEKNIDSLLNLISSKDEPFYWIRLSKESDIIEVSDNSVSLFGRPKEEIEAAKPVDLVVPAERERMKKRAEYREVNKRAIYYFTEVYNKKKRSSRLVIVYSFPILNRGKYVGAIAALKPLDEIESESLPD